MCFAIASEYVAFQEGLILSNLYERRNWTYELHSGQLMQREVWYTILFHAFLGDTIIDDLLDMVIQRSIDKYSTLPIPIVDHCVNGLQNDCH